MEYSYTYSSPIGKILLKSDGEYLTELSFVEKGDSSVTDLPIFLATAKWLDIYFCGKIPSFTPKYRLDVTPFQREVLDIMKDIPYGRTTTYVDIAKKIAKKRGISKMSSQAVGGAVGRNPIGIILPCHRVIGKDGNLVGYNGGLDKKIKLLEIEKVDLSDYFLPKRR